MFDHKKYIVSDEVLNLIREESAQAIRKHGDNTPLNILLPSGMKFKILGEEIGEVNETYTYDKQTPEIRKKRIHELIQVANVAALWAQAEISMELAEKRGDFTYEEHTVITAVPNMGTS